MVTEYISITQENKNNKKTDRNVIENTNTYLITSNILEKKCTNDKGLLKKSLFRLVRVIKNVWSYIFTSFHAISTQWYIHINSPIKEDVIYLEIISPTANVYYEKEIVMISPNH